MKSHSETTYSDAISSRHFFFRVFRATEAKTLALLPAALREKFGELGLDAAQIETVLEIPEMASIIRYVAEAHDEKTAKTIANWCLGELQRLQTEETITWLQVSDALDHLVKLAAMTDGAQLSSTAAKELLPDIITKQKDPLKLAEEKNIIQVSDEGELVMIIEQVLSENVKAAEDVRSGEMKAIGFLVGQVMKASAGRANPAKVQELIKKQLGIVS